MGTYIESAHWSDGVIDNFSVRGARFKRSASASHPKAHNVEVALAHPLLKGERRYVATTWDMIDSFMQENEIFRITFPHPGDHYRLVIIFPDERPVKTARIVYKQGPYKAPYGYAKFQVAEGKRQICLEMRNVRPGFEAEINWEW